jgi:transmembrane 9 superfamily protein 3
MCADAGLFMLAYCVFFYFTKTTMLGFLQTSFFFAYTMLVCYAFLLTLGAAGYHASFMFLRLLYKYAVPDPSQMLFSFPIL